MIHYQLRCRHDHQFDGWFRDSAAFDLQAGKGLIDCPECGDTQVERALMAPAVPRKGERPAPPMPAAAAQADPPAKPPVPAKAAGGAPMPAQLLAMLQRVRTEVESNCDYVGENFAAEARKIHRGESDRRGIYGEATEEQAESLAEDGISVARVPWVPRADG